MGIDSVIGKGRALQYEFVYDWDQSLYSTMFMETDDITVGV